MKTVSFLRVHDGDLETRRLEELVRPIDHHCVLVGEQATFAELWNQRVLEEVVGFDVRVR